MTFARVRLGRLIRQATFLVALVTGCSDNSPTDPAFRLAAARSGGGGGVSVKSTFPATGQLQATLNIRVRGSGFSQGSRAIWALHGDTALSVTKVRTNSTTYVSSSELTANITIDADATLDLYDVVVITPTGKKGIGIELFEVVAQIIDLDAGDFSTAYAVNNNGQVVGGGGTGVGAFLWEGGSLTRLGVLPGASYAAARDINDDGVVVGQSGSRAFTWTRSGGMEPLAGTLGGTQSEAWGINLNGDIVGSSTLPGDTVRHATLWSNGVVIDLQASLPPGYSYAWDINDNKVVVGEYHPAGGQARAFRWTAETGVQLMIPPQTQFDIALDVNASGTIVGWRPFEAGGSPFAFSWTQGSLANLGTLGGNSSVAIAINDAGVIVGRADTGVRRSGAMQHVAFIWTAADGMRSLGLPSGRDYAQAWDVSETNWVAGESWIPSGASRATLWILP